MRGLLAGKEALKAFYARYSAFVNAFLRFITAFAAVFLINQNIGLMPKLSGGLVPLFAGIICAFLPFGAIAFLIGIFLLAQLFAASMEVALITLVFLLIVVLLYYGFQPRGADGLCAQETVDQLLLGDRDRSWPYFTDSGCVYRRFPLWRSGVRAGADCRNDWCGYCIADLSAVCFFGRLQPD